ncbi:Remodeling and spacing factor 1 [Phytophthora citrophthora]|uniref:Remodeling and spacing factor 1 n=1 Tax=Phytophthora citrophthora TaxID=4793 RepID=A0AAD9LGV5_9STRA|nr:Remodeling and spacing factor 1 [Phytophthora citrophthora]
MNKKYPWFVHLLRFLRDAEYPPAISESTKFPANSAEAEKRGEFYFDLPVAERVAILKFLCEIQFDRNYSLVEQIDGEEAESMRNEPVGVDALGRSYYILEDAATVPNGAVWVCRCTKVGGADWETVCNDLESVELLVEQLSLSVDSADLKLWQTLSRRTLKKLTRQQERRRRNERWKHELAVSGVDSFGNFEGGIGRRSLRNRRQVNYATIDEEEEEEDIVADSDKSDDDEEEFEALSDNGADSETDGDIDEEDKQPQRSTRNSGALAKKRKGEHCSTRSSKRIRRSPHEVDDSSLRRSTRTRTAVTITSSSDSDGNDSDE